LPPHPPLTQLLWTTAQCPLWGQRIDLLTPREAIFNPLIMMTDNFSLFPPISLKSVLSLQLCTTTGSSPSGWQYNLFPKQSEWHLAHTTHCQVYVRALWGP
jgi:hypothetical protein